MLRSPNMHPFITWLFPERESYCLVRTLSQDTTLAAQCHHATVRIPGSYYLLSYHQPLVRALIHECKFHRNRRAMTHLQTCLYTFLSHHEKAYDLFVPVPLSSARKRVRGHNQVTSVVLPVLEKLKRDDCFSDCLRRVINTTPQAGLSRQDRLHNLDAAFTLAPEAKSQLPGRRVLLVDDVATTGTTLEQCVATLKSADPAAITTLTFAH